MYPMLSMNVIPTIPVDWTPFLDKAGAPFPLSVIVIYNDMHAALRAAQVIERFTKKYQGRMEPRLQPLPLSQLSDPACYDRSLASAASADMIIVSINGPGGLPPALKQWIQDCTTQKREGDSAVVALLGSMDESDPPDSPRLQFLKNAVRRAGLDFFTPTPGQPEVEYASVAPSFEVVG